MSDTGGFPLVGGSPAFPGKNNIVRDGSGSNSFGWENLNFGTFSVVSGYRSRATGNYSAAIGLNCLASGSHSFAGGSGNTASSTGSTVFGNTNTVSGAYSFAAGLSNTVSNQYCVAFGSNNTVSQTYAFACGYANTASGAHSFIAGGQSNTASGSYSFACGLACTASGLYSFAVGVDNQATAASSVAIGARALAARTNEFAHGCTTATYGLAQHGWLILANQSTSATPILLYTNGINATGLAGLAAGARWKCTLEIIATTTGAIDKSASWEYKFQIDRPTTAATTIIRTTPLLTLSDGSNAGAPPAGWSVAITADTANGCPQIQVTGDTDTINWTAALHYVQSIRV